jgi:hypothetical protein
VLGVLAIAGNESEDPLVQHPPTCIDHMTDAEFSSVCVRAMLLLGCACLSVSWGEQQQQQQLATHADMPRCLLRNLLFPSHSLRRATKKLTRLRHGRPG